MAAARPRAAADAVADEPAPTSIRFGRRLIFDLIGQSDSCACALTIDLENVALEVDALWAPTVRAEL